MEEKIIITMLLAQPYLIRVISNSLDILNNGFT